MEVDAYSNRYEMFMQKAVLALHSSTHQTTFKQV